MTTNCHLFMSMNTLNILSHNIWFDDTLFVERTISLMETIKFLKPDIICLQEVKPMVYEILINQLRDFKYHFPKKIVTDYGCVILSRFPILKCLDYKFDNSKMGRSLIIIKVDYPYHKTSEEGISVETVELIIANTHFESQFKKHMINEEKIKQYSLTQDILDDLHQKYKNIILCCDTNLLPSEENKFMDTSSDQWKDAWKLKGSNLNKYTYDGESNLFLQLKNCKYRSRLDRILFRTTICYLEEFNMIKTMNEMIPTSDHFGIYGKFEIKI
jgi:exonuclease III